MLKHHICGDRRGKGRRCWSNDDPPGACPTCGDELEELQARRQELHPTPHESTKKKEAEKALHNELRDRERGDPCAAERLDSPSPPRRGAICSECCSMHSTTP